MTAQEFYERINDTIKIGCQWQYLSKETQNKWAAILIDVENDIISDFIDQE